MVLAAAANAASAAPPSLQEATKNSTQAWQQHLAALFHHCKDRFPDVVWDITSEDDDGVMEQVWGHKAIVYARAPPSFQQRYFTLRGQPMPYSSSPTPSYPQASALSLGLEFNMDSRASTPSHRSSSPAPSTNTQGQTYGGSGNSTGMILRIPTSHNPTLFSNQLEYLYTGQGIGDAFEFLFDSNEQRGDDDDSLAAEESRIDKLRKDLVFMWRSRLYSDVRIALTGNFSSSNHETTTAVFATHRFILVSRCPYFHTALLSWPSPVGAPPPLSRQITASSAVSQAHSHSQSENGTLVIDQPTLTLPSPPFTPASVHFTLGFIYTGTLVFSHRSYDLDTAFAILRSATYLGLQTLYDEIQARIVQEMMHGLFHAFLEFNEYEKLTAGRWGTGGCRCRQCARRVPRILEFSMEEDVRNLHLERGARRALVGLFGEGWCTQDFACLSSKVRESLVKGVGKRTNPINALPLLFAAEHALKKLGNVVDTWGDVVREMVGLAKKNVEEVICARCKEVFEQPEWMELMESDGDGFEDMERVEWIMQAVGKGVNERNAGMLYQTLVGSILLRPHPTDRNSAMLTATSHIRVQVDQARTDLLKWIGKRWASIRQENGFEGLEGWALKEIRDGLDVPIEDLIAPPPGRGPRSSVHRSHISSRNNAQETTDSDGMSVHSMRVTVLSRNVRQQQRPGNGSSDSNSTPIGSIHTINTGTNHSGNSRGTRGGGGGGGGERERVLSSAASVRSVRSTNSGMSRMTVQTVHLGGSNSGTSSGAASTSDMRKKDNRPDSKLTPDDRGSGFRVKLGGNGNRGRAGSSSARSIREGTSGPRGTPSIMESPPPYEDAYGESRSDGRSMHTEDAYDGIMEDSDTGSMVGHGTRGGVEGGDDEEMLSTTSKPLPKTLVKRIGLTSPSSSPSSSPTPTNAASAHPYSTSKEPSYAQSTSSAVGKIRGSGNSQQRDRGLGLNLGAAGMASTSSLTLSVKQRSSVASFSNSAGGSAARRASTTTGSSGTAVGANANAAAGPSSTAAGSDRLAPLHPNGRPTSTMTMDSGMSFKTASSVVITPPDSLSVGNNKDARGRKPSAASTATATTTRTAAGGRGANTLSVRTGGGAGAAGGGRDSRSAANSPVQGTANGGRARRGSNASMTSVATNTTATTNNSNSNSAGGASKRSPIARGSGATTPAGNRGGRLAPGPSSSATVPTTPRTKGQRTTSTTSVGSAKSNVTNKTDKSGGSTGSTGTGATAGSGGSQKILVKIRRPASRIGLPEDGEKKSEGGEEEEGKEGEAVARAGGTSLQVPEEAGQKRLSVAPSKASTTGKSNASPGTATTTKADSPTPNVPIVTIDPSEDGDISTVHGDGPAPALRLSTYSDAYTELTERSDVTADTSYSARTNDTIDSAHTADTIEDQQSVLGADEQAQVQDDDDDEALQNTASKITIRPRKSGTTLGARGETNKRASVLSTTGSSSTFAKSSVSQNDSEALEHKKTDSNTTVTGVPSSSSPSPGPQTQPLLKKKGSNDTIRYSMVSSGATTASTAATAKTPLSHLPPSNSLSGTVRARQPPHQHQPILQEQQQKKQPCVVTPQGITLDIGIPCIISSKRRRFKAFARYIGEVEGELGPWVGVEVPFAEDWSDGGISSSLLMDDQHANGAGGRQWHDGSWGGVKYFELSAGGGSGLGSSRDFGAGGGGGGGWDYDDERERAIRRRRVDQWSGFGDTVSVRSGFGGGEGRGKKSKRMRSVSPAVSDMSVTESRGLFVRPQQVLYVVDAV